MRIECGGYHSFPAMYLWISRGDFRGWGGKPGYNGDWSGEVVLNMKWGEGETEPTRMNLGSNTFTFPGRESKDKMMANDWLLMEVPWIEYGAIYFGFDLREGQKLLDLYCF